ASLSTFGRAVPTSIQSRWDATGICVGAIAKAGRLFIAASVADLGSGVSPDVGTDREPGQIGDCPVVAGRAIDRVHFGSRQFGSGGGSVDGSAGGGGRAEAVDAPICAKHRRFWLVQCKRL